MGLPLLDADGAGAIKDSHRRSVTAVLLENQERFLREQAAFESGSGMLTEAPTNSGNAVGASDGFTGSATDTGPVAGFDPVLISLIRRSMPNLVAYELAGVQPMNGPTGLIFAMRSRYTDQSGTEAFFNGPIPPSLLVTPWVRRLKVTTVVRSALAAPLVSVRLAPNWATTPRSSTLLALLWVTTASTPLVKVWRLVTPKPWATAPMAISTKWRSRSRRSPLPPSPVL